MYFLPDTVVSLTIGKLDRAPFSASIQTEYTETGCAGVEGTGDAGGSGAAGFSGSGAGFGMDGSAGLPVFFKTTNAPNSAVV